MMTADPPTATVDDPRQLAQKPRSLLQKLINKTHLPLTLVSEYHESGRWWTTPPVVLSSHSEALFASCNRDGGIMTGTTGAFAYQLGATDYHVVFFFSNPYVGSFKAGCIVSRGLPPSMGRLKADYGSSKVVNGKKSTSSLGPVIAFAIPASGKLPAEFIVTAPEDELPEAIVEQTVAAATDQVTAQPLAIPRINEAPFSLRFLSFNLFLRPYLISDSEQAHTFSAGDYKKERVDLFCAQALDRYDVLCLQEVFDATSRDVLKQRAADRGLIHALDLPMGNSDTKSSTPIGSGLLVLSRFPLLDAFPQPFYHCSGADQFSAKGFVSFRVLLPSGGALNVINLHLQASASVRDPPYSEGAGTRFSQLVELVAFLRGRPQLLAAGVIIVGDFNLHHLGDTPSGEYERMLELLRTAVGPAGTVADLFSEAKVLTGTWRSWARVAAPAKFCRRGARVLGRCLQRA
ncbi:hypothetical protein AMAG_10265 [Allomyces macrogynus ATCC 38327]|uniref:Endonuclease/exonuclease/phosphatase domain-containing protein n=1 Tax=Allomyces macrogynus (strain ATCC 38327) TaxID=578462 RepID=A0A0L0SUD8_ALLM3|nr:hypothetical protein AMAG_10265 [Allomyces macrogynus ATCC 38327]|eukprot:KNE65985.1 hypothetical protein AMAG_10265 [Allomyces macrogynus ATCC 38327]